MRTLNTRYDRAAATVIAFLLWVTLLYPAQKPTAPTEVHVKAGLASQACTVTLSSPSASTVQSNINSAADGAKICVTGSSTWSGTTITPSAAKAVTLACATPGSCPVSSSGTIFGLPTGSSTKLFRITGFTFTHSSSIFMWTCPGGGCTNVWSNFRFDHNSVSVPTDTDVFLIGENSANQYVYGVIDHNTFTSPGSSLIINWLNATDSTPPSAPMGTANNLFAEDNTVTFTNLTDLGTGCTDHWGQSAIVWRYNTTTNCRIISHGVTHGSGPSNFEIYNNTIRMNAGSVSQGGQACYRCIHHQGSNTYMVFNNLLTAHSGKDPDAIVFLHYRDYWFGSGGPGSAGYSIDSQMLPCDGTFASDGNRATTATWRGYPCYRQPGRDVSGAFKPIYSWNNRWSDTAARIPMVFNSQGGTPPPSCTASSGGTCGYDTLHIIQNRDWYDSVSASAQSSATSPFNGTTGMGFGTLANRPTTCTTATESGAGVGYFATNQGTNGTLYTCSATNTWSVYYTPYTYPHPLVGS